MLDTKDGEKFTFDFIADEDISQELMFKRIGQPIVDQCLQGYHSTLFAYGQTGSGKTFTIQGSNKAGNDMRGILPRQFEYMFQEISKIQAKHRFLKERMRQHPDRRPSVSPAGMKGSNCMNYKQFGENIESI